MTILRRTLALVACLTTGLLLAASVQGPTSARTVDERCAGHGRIPASALRSGVSLGCSLVGRTVYDGRVAVVVPPPGVTVAGDGISTHGEVVGPMKRAGLLIRFPYFFRAQFLPEPPV